MFKDVILFIVLITLVYLPYKRRTFWGFHGFGSFAKRAVYSWVSIVGITKY